MSTPVPTVWRVPLSERMEFERRITCLQVPHRCEVVSAAGVAVREKSAKKQQYEKLTTGSNTERNSQSGRAVALLA